MATEATIRPPQAPRYGLGAIPQSSSRPKGTWGEFFPIAYRTICAPSLRATLSPHHFAPPSSAARSRRPPAPSTRAARSRCPLAPTARAVRSRRNQPSPGHQTLMVSLDFPIRWGGGRERNERQVWYSRRRVASLGPVFVGDWGRGRIAGCFEALAMLLAVVTKGDAYLSGRLRGFSGGASLAELLLPASSLNRNSRNSRFHLCKGTCARKTRPFRHTEIRTFGSSFLSPNLRLDGPDTRTYGAVPARARSGDGRLPS